MTNIDTIKRILNTRNPELYPLVWSDTPPSIDVTLVDKDVYYLFVTDFVDNYLV